MEFFALSWRKAAYPPGRERTTKILPWRNGNGKSRHSKQGRGWERGRIVVPRRQIRNHDKGALWRLFVKEVWERRRIVVPPRQIRKHDKEALWCLFAKGGGAATAYWRPAKTNTKTRQRCILAPFRSVANTPTRQFVFLHVSAHHLHIRAYTLIYRYATVTLWF